MHMIHALMLGQIKGTYVVGPSLGLAHASLFC